MGETKWTPGAWTLNAHLASTQAYVRQRRDPHGPNIAVLNGNLDEWEANARLIAAAPDLYEALAGLANSDAQDEDHPCFCNRDHSARTPRPPHARYCTAARAALARARGETP